MVNINFGFCAFGDVPSDNINDMQRRDLIDNKGLITFGLDDDGHGICFDYRYEPNTSNPPIVIEYTNGDTCIDKDGQEKFLVLPVAKDFDKFLNMLYEE